VRKVWVAGSDSRVEISLTRTASLVLGDGEGILAVSAQVVVGCVSVGAVVDVINALSSVIEEVVIESAVLAELLGTVVVVTVSDIWVAGLTVA